MTLINAGDPMAIEKLNSVHLKQAAYWIKEREAIRRKKESGKPPPWTDNPLMAGTRWCCVRRMDDKVSRWLMENYYRKDMAIKQAVLAATMARLINRPETLIKLCPKGFGRFNQTHFSTILANMRSSGEQIFTGVYIINGANANGRSKAQLVMDNLQDMSDKLRPEDINVYSMQETHRNLMRFQGLGSFIAGQVVADLRHVLNGRGYWEDHMDWAPQGPGSSRGLNYVFDTPGFRMNQESFLARMTVYRDAVLKDPGVRAVAEDRGLEAHDWQNTLCEVGKWARLQQGGRSKNRYSAKPPTAQQPSLF